MNLETGSSMRKFSFFPQHHGRDCSDGFCLGGNTEDSAFVEWRLRVKIIVSIRLIKNNLTLACYQSDRTVDPFLFNPIIHTRIKTGKSRSRKPTLFGIAFRQYFWTFPRTAFRKQLMQTV